MTFGGMGSKLPGAKEFVTLWATAEERTTVSATQHASHLGP